MIAVFLLSLPLFAFCAAGALLLPNSVYTILASCYGAILAISGWALLTWPDYRWQRGAFERGLRRAPRRLRLIPRGKRLVVLRLTRIYSETMIENMATDSPLLEWLERSA